MLQREAGEGRGSVSIKEEVSKCYREKLGR